MISNNHAIVAGGIFYDNILFDIDSTVSNTSNTSDMTGSNSFVTSPSHLTLDNMSAFFAATESARLDSTTNTIIVNNFRSGDTLNVLTFKMRTDLGIEVTPLNSKEESTYRVIATISDKTQFKS